MRWLKKLWSKEAAPPAPVLLRVTDARGKTPPVLDVEARWLPSGRVIARSVRTADGLCVVHWRGDEDSVELRLRGVAGEIELTVERARADRGRVTELTLTPAPAPETVSPRLRASSMA